MPTRFEAREGESSPGNKFVGETEVVAESSVGDAALRATAAPGDSTLGDLRGWKVATCLLGDSGFEKPKPRLGNGGG